MTTIRRIYVYLLAFAGLAMLFIAIANLAQLLVDLVLHAPQLSSEPYVRDSVSLFAASALVGLPVWLGHWLWIGRLVRADRAERASTLRRLYLYAVLVGATLEMASSAREALLSAFAVLVGSTSSPTLDAIMRPLPFALVGFGVWLAHWRISGTDRAVVGERGGSASLRRWYLYGAAFVGLVLLLVGASGVLEALWRSVAQPGGLSGASLAEPAANALIGLGLWLVPGVLRLSDADRHEDDTSILRSVYLFLALALAVLGSLLGLSQLLYYAVGRLLGVDHPGGVGGDLLQAAAGPASLAIAYGAAWVAYAVILRPQPKDPTGMRDTSPLRSRASRNQDDWVAETPRQAGVRRLYTYLIALLALGVLASGVAGLLWTLADVILSDSAAASGSGWREQVALYATLTFVGLPAWLLHWRPSPGQVDEARSFARRLYVYLSLGVAMLALVGGAAAGLYQLLGLALGGAWTMSLAADLAHAGAVAAVAAVLAAYHWQVIRADARRAHVRPAEAVLSPGAAMAVVEIHAADADTLCTALAALRSTGVQVTVISEAA